jgi:hypothetical protein
MPLALLIATLAALACGPLLYAWARPRPGVLAFLDGFLFVSILGLVSLEVVPGTFSAGGLWSFAFLAAGLLGPTLMEHWISRARREAHLAALALAMVGLIVHSLGDGIALSSGDGHAGLALPLLFPVFGRWPPLLAIAGMCAGTVAGFAYGPTLGVALGSTGWAWFQALVAGSILHVVFGRPHLDEADHAAQASPRLEGLGNLCALAGLIGLVSLDDEPLPAAGFFALAGKIAVLSAPWLLGLYLMAGFVLARGNVRRGLRLALVELVDRSAAWALAALLVATLLLFWLWPALQDLPAAGIVERVATGLLAVLYAASLLRRGGRAWLASLYRAGAHDDHHHH